MNHRILIVDDDKFVCEDIATSLDSVRFHVDKAHDGNSAFRLFEEKAHHIVITDLKMGEGSGHGLELLARIKNKAKDTAVVVLTNNVDIQEAVKAMKLGADDYITKPYDSDQIAVKIEKIADRVSLREDNNRLRQEISSQFGILGNSAAISELKRQIGVVARTDSRVLITGPNGSGKELVAWSIRNQSPRSDKPFVTVNCAAIPENLIEAELFGTVRGAFTNAQDKKGRFELAHEGTLFLDEVGDMSLAAQAKVLRVLETGRFERVGGERSVDVDVRVISATNRDLYALMREGKFREDLFYRLSVVPLHTTPLRQRREDIPVLMENILRKMGKGEKLGDVFNPAALERLQSLEWSGNVRELNNVVERLLIFWDGSIIDPALVDRHLHLHQAGPAAISDWSRPLRDATNEFESGYIRKVIQECSANISDAAARLGLTRTYLYEKMKNLNIPHPKNGV
jgi:two-component system nitrogen regulation response regulator NtrX